MLSRMLAKPDIFLWSQRWFIALLWTAALLMMLALVIGTLLNALGGVPAHADFLSFYASSLTAAGSGRLYEYYVYVAQMHQIVPVGQFAPTRLSANLNPPVVCLLFLPLRLVSLQTAYYLFCFTQLALAYGVFIHFIRRLFGPHPALRPAALFVLGGYFPVMANMQLGQLGLLLFVFMLLGTLALRDGREIPAGLWLGLAVTLKVFVGVVFIWLALKRRYKVCGIGTAVFLLANLLALGVFGINNHIDWLHNTASLHSDAMSWNASLQGVLARYLGAGTVVSWFNLPLLVFALRALAISASAAVLIWMGRHARFETGYALTLPLMLFIAPLGWMYYFPVLLISGALLWQQTSNAKLRGTLVAALALSGIPQLISMADFYTPSFWKAYDKGGLAVTGSDGHVETTYYGVYHWFELPEIYTLALLLLIALPVLITRASARPQPVHGQRPAPNPAPV